MKTLKWTLISKHGDKLEFATKKEAIKAKSENIKNDKEMGCYERNYYTITKKG